MNGVLNIPSLKVGMQLEHLQEFSPALDPQVLMSPLFRHLVVTANFTHAQPTQLQRLSVMDSKCSPVGR